MLAQFTGTAENQDNEEIPANLDAKLIEGQMTH
jgi:hypothetical protein